MSDTLSPFDAELDCASEKPSVLPPRSSIAASKLRRVLVEGSKKSVASFFPTQALLYFAGSAMISFAVSISESISSTVRSIISIR